MQGYDKNNIGIYFILHILQNIWLLCKWIWSI